MELVRASCHCITVGTMWVAFALGDFCWDESMTFIRCSSQQVCTAGGTSIFISDCSIFICAVFLLYVSCHEVTLFIFVISFNFYFILSQEYSVYDTIHF